MVQGYLKKRMVNREFFSFFLVILLFYPTLATPIKEINFKGSIESSLVTGDVTGNGQDEIIFSTNDGILHCLNLQGQILWQYNLQSYVSASPTLIDVDCIPGKEIIIGNRQGILHIISGKGKLIKKINVGYDISFSSIASGDIDKDAFIDFVFVTSNNSLVAFSSQGELLFLFLTEGSLQYSHPLLVDLDNDGFLEILFNVDNGFIYALDYHGNVKWKFKSNNYAQSGVFIGKDGNDEIFYVASHDRHIYAISSSGTMLWKYNDKTRFDAPISLVDIDQDGTLEILTGGSNGEVFCLNALGKLLWKFKTNGPIYSGIVFGDIIDNDDEEIIVRSTDGYLYLLSLSGKLIKKISLLDKGISTPLFACNKTHNLLYVGTASGKLLLINEKDIDDCKNELNVDSSHSYCFEDVYPCIFNKNICLKRQNEIDKRFSTDFVEDQIIEINQSQDEKKVIEKTETKNSYWKIMIPLLLAFIFVFLQNPLGVQKEHSDENENDIDANNNEETERKDETL